MQQHSLLLDTRGSSQIINPYLWSPHSSSRKPCFYQHPFITTKTVASDIWFYWCLIGFIWSLTWYWANKSAYYSFMDAGTETKTFVTHGTGSGINRTFASAPLSPKVPGGNTEDGLRDAAHIVGLCGSWETLNLGKPPLLRQSVIKLGLC